MDCGRSISRARHSRFTPINSRINDMVLYATIHWLEAAMTCAAGGAPVVHDCQQRRATRWTVKVVARAGEARTRVCSVMPE